MLRYKFKSNFARPVYLIDGLRTPWLKKSPFSATDLALQTIRALLLRQTLTPQTIEHLIVGCTQSGPEEINLGSVLASRLGCGSQTAVYTLQSHDASGFQALDNAALAISSGRCELALVGSSEVMSRAPLWIDYERFSTLSKWVHSKSSRWRTTELNFLRWQQLVTFFSSQAHRLESKTGQAIGQAIETLAYRFKVHRAQMDHWSLQSQQRLIAAQAHRLFKEEQVTLYDTNGRYYTDDEGLKHVLSLKELAQCRPDMTPPFGLITKGNRAQYCDGAAFILLASDVALKKYHLNALVRLADVNWAGVPPSENGLGAAYAVIRLLKKQHLELNDIHYWEIDECFAGQLLACLASWQEADYCQQHWGRSQPFGFIPTTQINVDGDSLAMGHPLNASGIRITLHLAHVLHREKARLGIATGSTDLHQGTALLLVNDLKTRGTLW